MVSHLKFLLLLGIPASGFIGVSGLFGRVYAGVAAIVVVSIGFALYFLAERIVLTALKAVEMPRRDAPQLHRAVEESTVRVQTAKPRLYLIPDPQPNVCVIGRSRAHSSIIVTEGLMRLLNEREIRGIVAYAVSLIQHGTTLASTVAAALATLISYLTHTAAFYTPPGDTQKSTRDAPSLSRSGALLLALTTPMLVLLIQTGMPRNRVTLADEAGARLINDPEALAKALEKIEDKRREIPSTTALPTTAGLFIVNPITSGRRIFRLFFTQPPTEGRVIRLRDMTWEIMRRTRGRKA